MQSHSSPPPSPLPGVIPPNANPVQDLQSVLAVLLIVYALSVYRQYYAPPPAYLAKLTSKQRALLGLPQTFPFEINAAEQPPPSTQTTPYSPSRLYSATLTDRPVSTESGGTSPYGYTSPLASALSPRGRTPSASPYTTPLSPRSPVSPAASIRDEADLQRYLADYELREQRGLTSSPSAIGAGGVLPSPSATPFGPRGYGASPLHYGGAGTAAPLPYRTAPRVPPRGTPAGKGHGATRDEFGYFYNQAAIDLLCLLGLEDCIDEWSERMRKWLATHIFHDLVRRIDNVQRANLPVPLEMPLPANSSVVQTAPGGAGGFGGFSTPTSPLSTSTTGTYAMWYSITPGATFSTETARYSSDEAVRDRLFLEPFMTVLGCTSREYLIARLRELSKGGFLAAFRWNSGMAWRDKQWTAADGLPTDAQIVAHAFCTYMDSKLPQDPRFKDRPFTFSHFAEAAGDIGGGVSVVGMTEGAGKTVELERRWRVPEVGKMREGAVGKVVLYQSRVLPPHFEVLVKLHHEAGAGGLLKTESEIWPVESGRNNLFHALVLFVYYIKTRYDGILEQLDLGTPGIDLLRVVQTSNPL